MAGQQQVGMFASLCNSPKSISWHVNVSNNKKAYLYNYSCQEYGHRMHRTLGIHMARMNLLITGRQKHYSAILEHGNDKLQKAIISNKHMDV